MKQLFNLEVRTLKQKDASVMKWSTKKDRLVLPDDNSKQDRQKIFYVPINGVDTIFMPSKDCIITVGKTQVLMSIANMEKLKPSKTSTKAV